MYFKKDHQNCFRIPQKRKQKLTLDLDEKHKSTKSSTFEFIPRCQGRIMGRVMLTVKISRSET